MRYQFTTAQRQQGTANGHRLTEEDRRKGGAASGARHMSRDLQQQYMQHVLEQRRAAYEIERRYALLEIEAKVDAGAMQEHEAKLARNRIAQRNPEHTKIPNPTDPLYWQKLPLNAAERAAFKLWAQAQLTEQNLTPERRKKLLKDHLGRPVASVEHREAMKTLALALYRPDLVSNEEVLNESLRISRLQPAA